ncbi:MAG: hypothetical protein RML99_12855 [Anaerolineae bacterium]|nr:hypothetical protein [Anaerolineae bacterium]
MDFGTTISRAFNIVLQHRVLWILGFLASLTSGVSSTGNSLNVPGGTFTPANPSGELPPEIQRLIEQLTADPGVGIGALAGLLCAVLLLGLVLWIISIIAQGALIGGVRQIEEASSTSFGQAWSVGVNRFWPLLGLSLILLLPGLALVGLFVLLFGSTLILLIAAATSGDESAAATATGNVIALVCGVGILGCIGLLYTIIASALQTFGERAIVLENKGVVDGIGRGWEVLRSNLGNIILLALLLFVINLIVGFVISIVSGLLFAPTLIAALVGAGSKGGGGSALALSIITLLLVTIIGAIIAALFAAFSSTVWTLAYRQFTGASGVAAAEPASPAPLPTA